jgi:hypothetical protein
MKKLILPLMIIVPASGLCSNFAQAKSTLPTQFHLESASSKQLVKASQSNTQIDFSPLSKMLKAFAQKDTYKTTSQIQVTAKKAGFSAELGMQTETIVRSPNQYHSRLRLTPIGSEAPINATIISNGKLVWLYRPDLRQYTVIPYATFTKSDHDWLIGISSLAFVNLPAEFKQMATFSSDRLKQTLETSQTALRGEAQVLDNQAVYSYELPLPNGGAATVSVIPESGELKRLNITGKFQGMDMVITESILNRVTEPLVASAYFQFVPPQGTKQVKPKDLFDFLTQSARP